MKLLYYTKARIVCQQFFKKYLNNFNKKITQVNFRDKSEGWQNYCINIKFSKDYYKQSHYENIYMNLFLSDLSLRESCYNCSFKNSTNNLPHCT